MTEKLSREEFLEAMYLGLVLRFADPEFTQAERRVVTALYQVSPRELNYRQFSERTGYAICTVRNIFSGLRRKQREHHWVYYPINTGEGPTIVAVRYPEMMKFIDDLCEDAKREAERELKKSRE